MEKIDIHCHILPGLDDGAGSEKESIEMLRAAYRQGIGAVIATPHASPEYPKSRPDVIFEQCERLEKKAREEISPGFRIYPGQEILSTDRVLRGLEEGELLSLAGSAYVLLEFFPSTPYSSIYRVIREFGTTDFVPVLAHIERYEALREEGRVEELIRTGAYMQMNYRMIGGKWYESSVRWCREMLKAGNIHFLGTDMHNLKHRAPETEGAMGWLHKHLEESYLEDICRENVRKVLENRRI
ncbi:MAG: protein tyrosine phosphatase [Lachnospiraceae bacterium]|jgi:protein-tyrosine phosphatase|nr:protein tyrosine phosphatase [Lachnospiraceae bacterium]